MTKRTRLYVGTTIAVGMALVVGSLASEGAISHSGEYWVFCLLACVSSVMKVRLPGITGTISANFLFILLSMALFTFAETVVLAAAACLIQCLWRPKSKLRILQLSFNIAVLALSAGASYRMAHLLAGPQVQLAVVLSVAVAFYFTADTLLISGILSLVQRKPLFTVWRQCYLWSFPYYVAGAVVAGIVLSAHRAAGWLASLAVLPLMILAFVFYRICVERVARSATVAAQ